MNVVLKRFFLSVILPILLIEFSTNTFASQKIDFNITQDSCVDINLKNGRTIIAKIIKSNLSEILYQKCNSSDRKIYKISTDDVASLVKGDAKSQLEAYGKGKPSMQRKITNALLWTGFLNLFALLLLPTGNLLILICLFLALIFAIIGIVRLSKYKKYPHWELVLAFLIFNLCIFFYIIILPLITLFIL